MGPPQTGITQDELDYFCPWVVSPLCHHRRYGVFLHFIHFFLCIIFYWAWTLLEANNTCSLQPPGVSSVAPAWVAPWRWRFVQGLISEDKYEPVWKSQSLSTYLIWPVGSTAGFLFSTAGLFRAPMRIVWLKVQIIIIDSRSVCMLKRGNEKEDAKDNNTSWSAALFQMCLMQ